MLRAFAILPLLLMAAACSRCSKDHRGLDASPSSFEVSSPSLIDAPKWADLPSFTGYGLPPGCRFEKPIRTATLPAGKARLVAGRRGLQALAIAIAKDEHVDQAGVVALGARKVTPAPWAELDSPPVLENRGTDWFAAWTIEGDPRRALGWTGGDRANLLAEGDDLTLVDVACSDERCAVLTSLARPTRSAGATLVTTDGKSGHTPKRFDIDAPKGEPWAPLAILSFDGTRASVALTSGKSVAIWQAGGDESTERARYSAPFGAYAGTEKWLVSPAAPPARPCGREEFPILIRHGSADRTVRTPAPPESVVVRALGNRLLLAWVAPVSCQLLERRVVYLTLVSPTDEGDPSPMAVADATGFALASDGDRFSLWLLAGRELTWISARC